ncbi:MAG: ATP-dependent DNA helicase [Actinobacteria bacterium]|nr:ATP-dependent DNA helicase [Actinomycetota bacterium]
MAHEEVRSAMERAVAALPGGGEQRPGQLRMAEEVAAAIACERHLLVQAGTGTGKSMAYLVPVLLSGRPTVVATATKALQEQLVAHDLPFLHGCLGVDFSWALLKGRSNYLCRAALGDVAGAGDGTGPAQGALLERAEVDGGRLAEVVAWVAETPTGDRADLPFVVPDDEWSRLSVGVGECPGASRCSYGDTCFAEDARQRAAEADVVVVNTHLYGAHLASDGAVLPEHEVVVVDEAHALEDIATASLGATISPGRFANLARACRGLFTADHPAAAGLEAAGARLHAVLDGWEGNRVDPGDGELGVALLAGAEAAAAASAAARQLDVGGEAATRRERVLKLAGGLTSDLRWAGELGLDEVAWVEGRPAPALRIAPVDVGTQLAERMFASATVVLTSGTLAVDGSLAPTAWRLGLDRHAGPGGTAGGAADGDDEATDAGEGPPAPAPAWRGLDVGSPFDYADQALLYCAAHLPDPRSRDYEAAMLDELEALVRAAGGRTLALFTSRRAVEAAEAHLSGRLPWKVLVQGELPVPLLHQAFLDDETSVLLGTMSLWQGFDAPGPTCSLVVVDRLPFRRPDDPLAAARRDAATRARRNAFAAVDLPQAAVLLAQGVGRLVRSSHDRGVVAVLDRRLATASYRWTLVRSLPPMRRTKDPAEVRRVLGELAASSAAPAPA